MLNLYIVRHGESITNIQDSKDMSFEEREDPQLSPLGLQQVALFGERMSGLHLDAIYASPLERAVNTAYETAVRQQEPAPIHILTDLYERGVDPSFSFKTAEQLKEKFPTAIEYCEDYPIGRSYIRSSETPSQTLERAYRVINYIKQKYTEDEHVLLCAHGTFNNYLISAGIGFGLINRFNFSQQNTGLSKIHYLEDGHARLTCVNDTSHLYQAYPNLVFDF